MARRGARASSASELTVSNPPKSRMQNNKAAKRSPRSGLLQENTDQVLAEPACITAATAVSKNGITETATMTNCTFVASEAPRT